LGSEEFGSPANDIPGEAGMKLLEPIRTRDVELKNRIVFSPMYLYSARNGHPAQAETILMGEQADLIFLAREMVRDPYRPRRAAKMLGEKIKRPVQYERGW
jgi:2,4-dienoyl-CoA reductase-like NADH-dependent reductase (Old Yellow Enzyme family)